MKLVLSDKQAENIDDRTRHLMVLGSAGSGKTIFACVKVILYALSYENARIGVFRHTLPALRETAWKEIRELLKKYKIKFDENKSNGVITIESTGSTITFMPLDSDEKIRSLSLDYVYVEQAEEVDEDIYLELDLRIRNKVYLENWGQMLLVVQPSSKTHWLYKRFYQYHEEDDDYKVIHFSYLENPFLPKEQYKVYEDMKKDNPDKYRTHALGEWISNSKQIFVDNWRVGGLRPAYQFYVGGIDWGYTAPACFLLCGFYDEECYVLGEVYKSEMKTSQFIDEVRMLLAKHNLRFNDIYCTYADKADPEKIARFNEAGLFTVGGVKDVKAKIDTTQETKIHVSKSCPNLIYELPNYEWKRNRDGEMLEEPRKKDDHAIDALCYAIFGVRGKTSDYTQSNSVTLDEVYVY